MIEIIFANLSQGFEVGKNMKGGTHTVGRVGKGEVCLGKINIVAVIFGVPTKLVPMLGKGSMPVAFGTPHKHLETFGANLDPTMGQVEEGVKRLRCDLLTRKHTILARPSQNKHYFATRRAQRTDPATGSTRHQWRKQSS